MVWSWRARSIIVPSVEKEIAAARRASPGSARFETKRVYFSETMVMRGGTSSALISGYSTFLRLRSDARCCRRQERHERCGRNSGVRRRERHGERRESRRNGGGRSVGQRSAVRTGRTPEPRRIARPVVGAGSGNPTRAGSLRAPPTGARPRPDFTSGFRVLGVYPQDAPSWAWFWCGPWWPWG